MPPTETPSSIRHVLMTADAVGGVWTYALDLARALGEHGIRVSLAVMGPSPSSPQKEDVAAVAGLTVYERPFALEWMDDPWRDVDDAGRWLLELERDLRPDVVHLNGYCHASLAWQAPILVVGHSCVLSWWRAVHGSMAAASCDEYARRVARGLRAAPLVVAPTADMLSMLELYYGPLGPRRVISNGRDTRSAAATAGAKEPMVLTAGRVWDQAKNVSAVTAVAASLSWPVYVAGECRRPCDTGVLAAADVPDGVHWLGPLTRCDLEAWMRRASLFVLPARYEPFGLAAVEAAATGCALVLGDIASQREIWGDAAVFVPPDDHDALASAIEQLAHDTAWRADLSARAGARARQLTPSRMADAYVEAYRELA